MRIGALRVELFISDANSLKAKRTVVKSLKDRLRSTFNVSVAEVDAHDKWQRAVIAVAAVGAEKDHVNSVLDKALDLIRSCGEAHITDHQLEIL